MLSLLRTHTIVALILLLLAFVTAIELLRPGTVSALWISNMLLFAAPLGIIAAGQTLVMLTGGIDLSVATVATASAYLMATHSGLGGVTAVLVGPWGWIDRRSDQRRRHRAIACAAVGYDPRNQPDGGGHAGRLQPEDDGRRAARSALHRGSRRRQIVRLDPDRSPPLGADRHRPHLHIGSHRIWPAALRHRGQ